MLRAELLFGRAAWDAFVREDLTAAFPEGLTILAARGQWREPSQLVLVLLEAEGAEARIAAAADNLQAKARPAFRRRGAQSHLRGALSCS